MSDGDGFGFRLYTVRIAGRMAAAIALAFPGVGA